MKQIGSAEIIAIGSELLTPLRIDTNSLYLTRKLNELGIEVTRKIVVGDGIEGIASSIKEAMARADLVITMGGLGPTEDDRTREAVSAALGRCLVRSPEWLDHMRTRFQRTGRPITPNNMKQADIIDGAEILENRAGSAPGQWIPTETTIVVMLPGPPREIMPMFETQALPRISRLAAGASPILTRILRVTGLPESQVDAIVGPIYRDLINPSVSILASPGSIELHIRAIADGARSAADVAMETENLFRTKLGDRVYGCDDDTLESVVAKMLMASGFTIATAESCTGGSLATRLTDVPGSSAYFLRGYVCYSNEAKTEDIGVPASLIVEYGAVSAEVADALARGAACRARADIGVGITGIAGPTGETPGKQIGLVYVAVAHADWIDCTENRFLGDRAMVRYQAAQKALDRVRMHLMTLATPGAPEKR